MSAGHEAPGRRIEAAREILVMKIEALVWVMALTLKRPDPHPRVMAQAQIGKLYLPGHKSPRHLGRDPGRWQNNRAIWRRGPPRTS